MQNGLKERETRCTSAAYLSVLHDRFGTRRHDDEGSYLSASVALVPVPKR